jgi:hypothetical protein
MGMDTDWNGGLSQRESMAVQMLQAGVTREAVMEATGLSFLQLQSAWLRRGRADGVGWRDIVALIGFGGRRPTAG